MYCKKNNMKVQKNFLAVFCIGFMTTVFAHGIWIEISNKGVVNKEAVVHLFFGELNHNLKSTGLKYYDGEMFADFKAFVKPHGSTTKQQLELTPSETSLSALYTPKTVGVHQIVAVNEDAPVRDLTARGYGLRKSFIYLRTTFEATSYRDKQAGKLDLSPLTKYDIVPFPAKNGYGEYDSHKSTWRVDERIYATFYIDYKPAKDQEIKISSPDGWSVIRKTNDSGEFNFTPYVKGVYQATYQKSDEKKGTYKGEAYDVSRIKSTTYLIIE